MSSFPKPDVKDEIIEQVARLVRNWKSHHAGGVNGYEHALWRAEVVLNSYGDTLMPEEVLKILTTLPGGE